MPLPVFGHVTLHRQPLPQGVATEAQWLADAAAEGRALAHLWEGAPGWVVPRSYTQAPHWGAVTAGDASGPDIQVRASGGGLVPMGPGLLNFSLCWPVASATPHGAEAVYRALAEGLAAAFATLGIAATPQAVEGSFCDGRWNLAVDGRKVAGTAQAWRRVGGVPTALAHAVIVVDADTQRLTDAANAVEAALGQPRRYRAEVITSLARAWTDAHGGESPQADFDARVRQALAQQFARVVPPRELSPPA